MGLGRQRDGLRGDALAALLLAALLTLGWTLRDWAQLSVLRLPDTDDVMRLQQIRDWLGGQAFGDLSQHRLGAAPGLAMHWSRLPDLVPGALIAMLTPLLGSHTAELVAVIAWPAMLLGCALLLVARIARTLGGGDVARTAIVVAGIAYPATTIFLPGRIDHHGFQVVLLLIVLRMLIDRPSLSRGLVAGFAAMAGIVIGMETAPLLAAAGLVMAVEWLMGRHGANDRMMGFGIALGLGALIASMLFRTDQWDYAACDGFTATAWRAAQIAAFLPMTLALGVSADATMRTRALLAGVASVLIGGAILLLSPQCLSPYGAVDPMLARLWLTKVGEAQPLFAAPPAVAIGYAGVMVAGVLASVWVAWRSGDRRWLALLALQIAALALTCAQLRGAYAGAMLAAPALAAVIAAARRRGAGWMAGAWIASAGMLYPIAANAFTPPAGAPTAASAGGGSCTSPMALARLAALPAGRLMAPLDLGAYAIGATRLSVVAAPYHRNNAGNAAAYRFFLGTPEGARRIAAAWAVRYVAVCAGSFDELGQAVTDDPRRLIGGVRAGRYPAWLHPLGASVDGLQVFAVEPGLSRGVAAL